VHCIEVYRLNMTLMALVSAERRAMSKPLTIDSSEKPRRWVMRGARSTFLSSSKLKQSGYCSKHLNLDSLSYTHCSPAKQKSSSCTGVACLSSKACCQCSMLFTCMHMSCLSSHSNNPVTSTMSALDTELCTTQDKLCNHWMLAPRTQTYMTVNFTVVPMVVLTVFTYAKLPLTSSSCTTIEFSGSLTCS